jgi:hypothetical protein
LGLKAASKPVERNGMRVQESERENGQPEPKSENPFGEEEQRGDEQPRIAPGTEREYQGEEPDERRAPGRGKDDPNEDSEREIA